MPELYTIFHERSLENENMVRELVIGLDPATHALVLSRLVDEDPRCRFLFRPAIERS